MTESTSADGRKTPAIGERVCDLVCGANSGVARIWARKSGLADTRNQILASGSGENATCVCVRAVPRRLPARMARQFAHAQFHWGKPPPAAEPRILRRIGTQRTKLALQRGDKRRNTNSPLPFATQGKQKASATQRCLRDYSSALAYELISQFRSISSCRGVTHSMSGAPLREFNDKREHSMAARKEKGGKSLAAWAGLGCGPNTRPPKSAFAHQEAEP